MTVATSVASTTSPRVWDPSHAQTLTRQQGPISTPAARLPRKPASVAQNMPPFLSSIPRSPPRAPQDPRSTSPNYFGLTVDHGDGPLSSSAVKHARTNWAPPSSNVRSTAAASPSVIPADQNPDFEAFRKQSESNAFNLGKLHNFNMGSTVSRPSLGRASTTRLSSEQATTVSEPRTINRPSPRSNPMTRDGVMGESLQSGRSPKRLLSHDSSNILDRPRRGSPASFTQSDLPQDAQGRSPSPTNTRFSLPLDRPGYVRGQSQHYRADTLPATLDPDAPTMVTPQHVVNLMQASHEDVLLLDLRVSTQYARSRILGALSLCIPTTLLKRPSFNVQKLAETFKDEEQRDRFERWESCKYIVVYDANSAQVKDATTCVNTLKKFANEGWQGSSYVVRGGFAEFSKKFPSFVDSRMDPGAASSPQKLTLGMGLPEVAPVIGGCPMPATKNAANPFFGNIRQNMDLIGGVGQMTVKRPATLSKQAESELPTWLRQASDEKDHGKAISDRFLQIEKREQKRMQEALSGNVTYGTPGPESAKAVQIAGIEKGSKNRYNNIWPYEHSRVKLQGVPNHGCDYFNANHIKTPWSNKRYIATQGPIPATFADFWNVVWQQDVRVLVMLTAEKEGGQVKAHNYWEAKQYGPLDLDFLSEHRASLDLTKIRRHREQRPAANRRRSTNPTPTQPAVREEPPSPVGEQPFVTIRKFTLSHENHPFERVREITQLHYSGWPDFGAPAHPAELLALVEQCDAVVRSTRGGRPSGPEPPNSRPVLVHCSAGCGRTGTFCTVDTVIDMLRRQRLGHTVRQGTPMDIDQDANAFFSPGSPGGTDGSWVQRDDQDLIEKTVEEFRHQRLSMVQSLRQFVLCYESVLEWLAEQQPRSA